MTDEQGHADLHIDLQDLAGPLQVVLLNENQQPTYRKELDAGLAENLSVTLPLSVEQAINIGIYSPKSRLRADPASKRAKRCAAWRSYTQTHGEQARTTLCFARTVVDFAGQLENPQTKAHRAARDLALARFTDEELTRATEVITNAGHALDDCMPTDLPDSCLQRGGDPSSLAEELLFGDDRPGTRLLQRLSSVTPDPRTGLGDGRIGTAFTVGVKLPQTCIDRMNRGELPADIIERMHIVLDDPQVQKLHPPQVNLVDIWARDPWRTADVNTGGTVRLGQVHAEELTFQERVPLQDEARTISTDVELDGAECLILEPAEDGRQVFFTDVQPGQVVTLKGSGFVASRARGELRFRRYEGADEDGRMTFLPNWEAPAGSEVLDLPVHGSVLAPLPSESPLTFVGDQIVFSWPAAAADPGLYRLDLSFVNETDHYIALDQDPVTCAVDVRKEGDVFAPPLHFVVTPLVEQAPARLTASRVDCLDETDPESAGPIALADDATYEVTGTRFAPVLADPTSSDPNEFFDLTRVGDILQVSGRRRFWDAPDSWQPDLQAFPAAPDLAAFIEPDEIVAMSLKLFEVDGDLDVAILRTALIVLLIIIVIVILVSLAAAIILLVAVGVIEVASLGAGTPLAIIIGALAAFVTGVAFTALMAVIDALAAAVPGVEVMAAGATAFTGQQLSHLLSPLRLHRVIWSSGSFDVGDPSINARRISVQVGNGTIVEVFRGQQLGGEYDLTAVTRTRLTL
ncbi:hypothetical protein [Modestobacter altitudinis]|uniref:hypothetical protein n=1 Tax=Modestobacter altitudinis TaxID=2213158 RepID=UPI00110C913B|nr:hypothetical protein [Modestobacter altitudinis]